MMILMLDNIRMNKEITSNPLYEQHIQHGAGQSSGKSRVFRSGMHIKRFRK